jgi:basic membrane protein A
MIIRVFDAVFQTLQDVNNGSFTSGVKVYDLKSNGVGLSPMTYTKDKIGQANIDKVAEVAKKIADGVTKVPTTEAELKDYLAGSR